MIQNPYIAGSIGVNENFDKDWNFYYYLEQELEDLGYCPNIPHIETFYQPSDIKLETYSEQYAADSFQVFDRDYEMISKSDSMCVIVDKISMGVGLEIGIFYEQEKPILAVLLPEVKQSMMALGCLVDAERCNLATIIEAPYNWHQMDYRLRAKWVAQQYVLFSKIKQ